VILHVGDVEDLYTVSREQAENDERPMIGRRTKLPLSLRRVRLSLHVTVAWKTPVGLCVSLTYNAEIHPSYKSTISLASTTQIGGEQNYYST
jgi:hypothetical protein